MGTAPAFHRGGILLWFMLLLYRFPARCARPELHSGSPGFVGEMALAIGFCIRIQDGYRRLASLPLRREPFREVHWMLMRVAFREADWHTGTAAASCFDHGADCVEWQRGVKTKFCPDVAGFCPGVSWILSWCVRGLSWCAVNKVGRTFRIGSNCSSRNRVKVVEVQVETGHWCCVFRCTPTCLAREPEGVGYDSGEANQGESVQR